MNLDKDQIEKSKRLLDFSILKLKEQLL